MLQTGRTNDPTDLQYHQAASVSAYARQVPEMSRGKKGKGAAPWEELSQLHLCIQSTAASEQLSTVADEVKNRCEHQHSQV